ncbi:MAG TPA: FHA domain-containing protein [Holophaga sp.]|nr:FHA domain-containing protein [Holophaga sp.]
MIVVCPSCQARFQYDDARFQGVPSKRFRCPKCEHVFEVANPLLAAPELEPMPEPLPEPMPAPVLPPSPTLAAAPSVAPAPPPTVAFDSAAFARKVSGASQPTPAAPVPGLPPGIASGGALSGQETTARRDREAFLTSVGVGAAALPLGMRFSLAYLSGPNASTVKQLESPQTLIGRDDGDVITKDPETSRRHAMLEIHSDGTVWLTDMGSTNGTFVDGVQIFGTLQISNRQEFTCGKSTFMLLIRKEDSLSMD